VPCSGIDTEMQDGVIIIRRVGYLDINYIYDIKSTGYIVVPLSCDVTTANVPDNHVYPDHILSCLYILKQ